VANKQGGDMAAKDRECDFQDIYLGVWPAREEKCLYELATEYHERTETYDRTVCTGGFRNGRILPATGHETMLINRNALAIRQELREQRAPSPEIMAYPLRMIL
jgi:hypothetical protein